MDAKGSKQTPQTPTDYQPGVKSGEGEGLGDPSHLSHSRAKKNKNKKNVAGVGGNVLGRAAVSGSPAGQGHFTGLPNGAPPLARGVHSFGRLKKKKKKR